VRVAVLGPLAVAAADGALGPRDRVVLSVVVLHGHQVVSAERLADALWGDAPPASANKVVQGCIVRLRKVLGPTSIETHASGYRLALGDDDVDLWDTRDGELLAAVQPPGAPSNPQEFAPGNLGAIAFEPGRASC